jgi:hypothetical protein
MRRVRFLRNAITTVAGAGVVSAIMLSSITPTALGAPDFTCAQPLQQACAIVFYPVCSKHPCG